MHPPLLPFGILMVVPPKQFDDICVQVGSIGARLDVAGAKAGGIRVD